MTTFIFQYGFEVAGFGSDLYKAVEHAQTMGFEVEYEDIEMFGASDSRNDGEMYWTNDQQVIEELGLIEF